MKRKVIIISGSILLIIGVLVTLPFFFKDQLLARVKSTMNSRINAKVDFSDFKLSLFSQFPKVEMELRNLSLVGIHEFGKDTIFSSGSVSTTISLAEMMNSKGLELKNLTFNKPRISLITDNSGRSNWDIVKASNPVQGTSRTQIPSSGEAFKMKLSDIEVNNLNLTYSDQKTPMKVMLKNTNLKSNGTIAGAVTSFDLLAEAGEFILEYNSVQYISKTKLKAETLLKVDFEKMNFTFDKGNLIINNLPLEINGSFVMPSDSMFFDIGFKSEKSDFATILALVPADYQKYLEKSKIDGSSEFKGSVKGLYYKDIYPAVEVLLAVSNASFKYQNLPESIRDIQVSAQISKPQGDLNLLKVNVDKAHATIKNNPVNLSLLLSDLMTDPNIDASFSGIIDFASLKQAIPIDSLDITGIMKARLHLSGRMSAIEKQQYEKFQSDGEASLQNFRIVSNQLAKPVEISQGQIKANTKQITVDQFDGKIGQSDFSLRGEVSNYLAYIFKNEVLEGNFGLKSTFMNFSELSNIQRPTKKVATPQVTKKVAVSPIAGSVAAADSVVAFRVSEKLNLSFQSAIQRAIYDNVPISNLNGLVKVKEQKMELSNLTMEIMQGRLTMNGSYTSNKENKPLFDLKMNLEDVDLPSAFQSFGTVQRYMPIAGKSQGKISSQFSLSGAMNEKMSLIPVSLNGMGNLSTQNIMIVDSPVFDQIRGIIKKEKLKNVKIDDFTAKFQFENGRLTLNPFKTKVADQQATIYGNLSAVREINLNMDFIVNREDLGADINKGIDILPGSQNIKMVEASVILKGSLSNPDVSLDLSKARNQIEQEVKKASIEDIKGSVKKIGDELMKLFK